MNTTPASATEPIPETEPVASAARPQRAVAGDASAYRWLVTGARGQLGTELVNLLGESAEVRALARADLDLTDAQAVQSTVDAWLAEPSELTPVIINTAAYTAVDAAESDEDAALAVNGDGPRNLATATAGRARLIHVSTDYVFAGDATAPYGVDDLTEPRTAYGRTKLAGDLAVREVAPDTGYVVRTAWVYGAYGPNFVKTMAKLSRERETLQVVNDQLGSPTWTYDLASGLIELAMSGAPAGNYHCTGSGQTSWYEFTQAIFTELGLDPARVEPTTSDAFVRPAPRPAFSVLSQTEWAAAGLAPMRDWRSALHAAFEQDGAALRNES
ncbi:dTDP-4-dehydrorhamnose reductase [Antricoccus suffuscus]|uniref:dTDP-4-dehydrorhamnose reductase n=1 Tax=Antricoccus suffuscus TaxID=1629062 RepID=A0A2T0ZQI2_9ACTN|nr:dTDP-4-dehydrorhamnose reductase [Antricoccus suffuscus]PRZ38612.1 dTDP-4-dehydrorhamnose reductase [Antricoccus suffuscus]